MDAVTLKIDKHGLDFLVWAVEAYIARAEGASYDPYPMTSKSVLRELKAARAPKVNAPELKPQGFVEDSPEDRIAKGLRSAGYILTDRHDHEVMRGDLDEIRAYLYQNHPLEYGFYMEPLSQMGYTLKEI